MAVLVVFAAAHTFAQPAPGWRDAPALLALFAPAGAYAAAYRAYVSPSDLDTVLRRLETDATLLRTSGAWQPRPLLPADAFGQTGRYDRSKLARLYGATRARVARGARREREHIVESWTLISPYPDPTLERLEPGTLLVVVRLP